MNASFEDAGKLVLRLLVGGLLILHGLHKVFTGPAMIAGMLTHHGWPGFFAWAVYLGEVLGPLLVIVGLYTRVGGLLILVNMIVATLLAYGGNAWHLNPYGGWVVELEAFYGAGGLAILLLGAGRYSIGGAHGRYN
ncbi:MAG: DoxX family protein [Gammaproteobacteria bacterium]|nr:DoxX family protein [Gammaproteobacteria bacterium]